MPGAAADPPIARLVRRAVLLQAEPAIRSLARNPVAFGRRDVSQHVPQLREIYRLGQMIIKASIASAPDIVVLAARGQRNSCEPLAAFRFTNHVASAAVR